MIRGGLVGPKPRAKAVGDGQSVNIPIPSLGTEGVTQEDSRADLLDMVGAKCQDVERNRKIRSLSQGISGAAKPQVDEFTLTRKPSKG